MNYFIAFIDENDFDWCVFETTDENYAYRVYEDLVPPPEYYKELRCTNESIDTYLDYDILLTD
jgi:hypothetical protein